jgi:hypothetical protein
MTKNYVTYVPMCFKKNINCVMKYPKNDTFTRIPKSNMPPLDPDEFGDTGNYSIFGDNIFMGAFRTSDYFNRIWRSVDRGRNWTAGQWFTTNVSLVPRWAFTDANNGMVLRGISSGTEKPLITTDGGTTWQESTPSV